MGLKAQSKALMQAAGVPLVPGYHGADQSPALLQAEADRMGYPVLIKASAGGGGKGMRVVTESAAFAEALASCQREATSSFGNAAVLVERYLQRPRHIEIQVFGDQHGNIIHLFERDCSVQRRHQKVLEEAPAPGMTPELRERMGAAAVAAARAVGYVGAGTVEFIVEQAAAGSVGAEVSAAGPPQGAKAPSGGSEPREAGSVGAFYFMEMNTRLQVEHPVTEAITGLDLVEWQLRVACGEPLPLAQDQVRMHGHSIEARLCAETPDKQFLPATGSLLRFAQPACTRFDRAPDGVRIDAGVREGDAISPYYDSMIAKLIVHGADRAQALARLDAALAQVHIVGVGNNVQFLRQLLRTRSFSEPVLDTALIERERAHWSNAQPLPAELAAAAVVVAGMAAEQTAHSPAAGWRDPWSANDGWASHSTAQRQWLMRRGDQSIKAMLERQPNGEERLWVGAGPSPSSAPQGQPLRWGYVQQPDAAGLFWLDWAGQRSTVRVVADGEQRHVFHPDGATVLELVDPLAHAGQGTDAAAGGLMAPMPGKLVSFAVKVGDSVQPGQLLAVMEAMKMEHSICAPAAGTVAELLYASGDQVGEGAPLLRMTEAAPAS
jgi:3-methylcrotonyl-CoA carboxylase alpha subunit